MKIKFLVMTIPMIIFPFFLGAQLWRPIQTLTWNIGQSQCPSIAADLNSNVHVTWCDDMASEFNNYDIYYKQSTDRGSSWGGVTRLTWNSGYSIFPKITTDKNNNIHIVWQDNSSGNYEIYYKRSTDAGNTWSFKRLTWSPGESYLYSITSDKDNDVHIVWEEESSGRTNIYYKKSINSGLSWSNPVRLTWNIGNSGDPYIGVDNNKNLYVVYCNTISGNWELYLKQSTDQGITWTGPKRLTWFNCVCNSEGIIVDQGDGIHIVWIGYKIPGSNYDIYHKHSTDGGVTWSLPKQITWNSGNSIAPALATTSDNDIHIVWQDDTPGNYEIFFKESLNGGTTWSKSFQVTSNEGHSQRPSFGSDSYKNLHVVWQNYVLYQSNTEIYYRKRIYITPLPPPSPPSWNK